MRSRILMAGTVVSAVFAMSALPSQAEESLPFGDFAGIQLQNVGTGQPLGGEPFGHLDIVNRTTLSATNTGVFVRNRILGAGTGSIATGPVQDIHLENVQGIVNIAVNSGINSNIQQSISVNYVIRLPAPAE